MKYILLMLSFLVAGNTAYSEDAEWQEWQKTSCYSKIAFRLKEVGLHGQQHIWKVQFRNDYGQVISFNYHVTDKLKQYDTTTHRKTMAVGQITDDTELYTADEDIFLLVDKVSLSPYPKDFIDCDKP